MAEDGEDFRVQLILRQRYQHIRFRERPLLPGATIEPHLGPLSLVALERAFDRGLARAVGAVRIGEIARDEDEIGLRLFDQTLHDRDVLVTQRPLAHLAGPVERQVEEPRGTRRDPHGRQRRNRLRFANELLEILDDRDVDVAGRLLLHPCTDRAAGALERGRVQSERCGGALDEVEMAGHVVIEHRDVPARHVRDDDLVFVFPQLAQNAAHRDDVVVGMRPPNRRARAAG